ncbi:MAG: AIR synthase-related protein [Phycisphaerales bacterium]
MSSSAQVKVHRFEVSPRADKADPIGEGIRRDAAAMGIAASDVRATHVYLVEAALSDGQRDVVAGQLLADPVTEVATLGASPAGAHGAQTIEVHPLPGVMDPVAQSVELAVRDLVGIEARVSTGWRYDIAGVSSVQADTLARRLLANPVIQRIERSPWVPGALPVAQAHRHAARSIPLLTLGDAELQKLSREAHLFLSLEEMRAIQAEYRRLGRDPRDIELEALAQTWSEHCVHKTLKSRVRYREGTEARGHAGTADGTSAPPARGGAAAIHWQGRPGHTVNADGSVTIDNLLKSTVAAATRELIAEGVDWTLSVFVDNSGVIAFDDNWGICIKVETHNHPSAIEPYGGAATGIGGCIRDVIGTGLGARPIANTDVFCVAHPDASFVPEGSLHPRRVLAQVVAGVRDYGNRMGIPTVNGAVAFDDRYVGNPLVFCGCIGLIPRDKVSGKAHAGDRIIALGGRTGRDGIHGATFSSAELEHTASDEFSHAVQIGNAITEKQVLEAIIRARDEHAAGPLFHGMTDCGAGGFSSAIGEMGKEIGAQVHLDRAPLKYAGLSYTEIWISEAQERMVLAVPPENVAALRAISDEEGVELADLGEFGTAGADLILTFHGDEVGRMRMHFLHDGIPMPTREAVWQRAKGKGQRANPIPAAPASSSAYLPFALCHLLSHPTIASKHWIIRQYDHEVRGHTVAKPLVGPLGRGPGDASVLDVLAGSTRGIAVACGLATGFGDPELGGDPYLMALAAIDEAVRNLVCVGADPARTAILDNFCWPSCAKPENMASLVRACEGCYDGAKAYRTPFVSGKDSLNNQLTIPGVEGGPPRTIEIPPTLLITGLGIVADTRRTVTMDAKSAGNLLVLVGETGTAMGGSHYQQLSALSSPSGGGGTHSGPEGVALDPAIPRTNLTLGPRTAHAVHTCMAEGLVRTAHDCSDGGLAVAVAEMLIAGSTPGAPIGAEVNLGAIAWVGGKAGPVEAALYAETPSRYVLEVRPEDLDALGAVLSGASAAVPHAVIGRLDSSGTLRVPLAALSHDVEALAAAWRGTLDW